LFATEKKMSVRDYIKAKYSEEEWIDIERDADLFVAGLESLQSSVSKELQHIMEEQGIGYREISRRLGITDTMTSKLLHGGNVNFETITKLSVLNRKIPKIVWVDPEDDDPQIKKTGT
jgi:DNA-binding Xre family transcriptional regulator